MPLDQVDKFNLIDELPHFKMCMQFQKLKIWQEYALTHINNIMYIFLTKESTISSSVPEISTTRT